MKTILSASLFIVFALAANEPAYSSQYKQPISEDQLIRLLQNKIPRLDLIRTVERYGVAFQVTSVFEQELTKEGDYLGSTGVAAIVVAIRANFRPPAVRPYRLTYRILKGHAVDLLLDGKIGRWDKALNGKFFIVQNEVFKTLSDLVVRFSEKFSDDKFVRIGGPRRTSRRLAAEYQNQEKRLFVGSSGNDYVGTRSGHVDPEEDEGGRLEARIGLLSADEADIANLVNSLNDSKQKWNLYAFKEKRLDILIFRRFAEAGDLTYFHTLYSHIDSDPLQEFYSYITKDYMPPDFGIMELSPEEEIEDGCGHHARAHGTLTWNAAFYGPLLRTNVAIIENISNEPITVGRFILRENSSTRLQSRSAVLGSLSSQLPEKQNLFAPGTLKPGESLVIPIEMTLKIEKKDLMENFDYPRLNAKYFADIVSATKENKRFQIPGWQLKGPIVSAEAFERIINNDKIDFLSSTEYVYGPSVSIESVEINRFGYLTRKFDPAKLLITSEFDSQDIGSCPHVYSYSTRQSSLLNEGVILYGRSSKLKESTDEIRLHQFNGEVLIQEQDPEDSFIDSVYIRGISADGKETIIYPIEETLRVTDGAYLKLRQGDRHIVKFSVPVDLAVEKYYLIASGYYVPYHPRSARLMRRRAGMQRLLRTRQLLDGT